VDVAIEREWQALKPISVDNKIIWIYENSIHLHQIPVSNIKSATFEAAITAELKDKLRSLLKTNLRYRYVLIYRVSY